MNNVFAVAASGMSALNKRLLGLTNDISNAQTMGYKGSRVEFETLFSKLLKQGDVQYETDTQAPQSESYGLGVRVGGTFRDMSQGAMETTKNPYDLGISGDGFFQVKLPSGDTAYTRSGSFRLDSNHMLVTAQGYPLEPEVKIPSTAVDTTIDPQGRVFVTLDGQTQAQQIAQLSIAKFNNPAGLDATGENLFRPTDASGAPYVGYAGQDGFGNIAQFSLEGSNVDVVSRLAELVMIQRNFDLIARTISAENNMMQAANQVAQG